MKSSNGVRSSSCGSVAFSDCFIAATRILRRRSVFSTFLSEYRHRSGTMRSTPISVTFSAIHSMRSMFFVGAIATVMRHPQWGFTSVVPTISTAQFLALAFRMRHR